MAHPSTIPNVSGLSRLKLYFALSRTPHGLIDMATPAMGALLWLGVFPPMSTVIVGLITAFAGYTAVYALNDIVDYRADKERVLNGELPSSESYLDDALVRHPMAYGFLSYREGLTWAGTWSAIAVCGAYILKPVCVIIFVAGCALEAVYCFLFRISPLRAFISGIVKTSGGLRPSLRSTPHPSPVFLLLLFGMLFCWEVGGQNVPHDWEAIEHDTRPGRPDDSGSIRSGKGDYNRRHYADSGGFGQYGPDVLRPTGNRRLSGRCFVGGGAFFYCCCPARRTSQNPDAGGCDGAF